MDTFLVRIVLEENFPSLPPTPPCPSLYTGMEMFSYFVCEPAELEKSVLCSRNEMAEVHEVVHVLVCVILCSRIVSGS